MAGSLGALFIAVLVATDPAARTTTTSPQFTTGPITFTTSPPAAPISFTTGSSFSSTQPAAAFSTPPVAAPPLLFFGRAPTTIIVYDLGPQELAPGRDDYLAWLDVELVAAQRRLGAIAQRVKEMEEAARAIVFPQLARAHGLLLQLVEESRQARHVVEPSWSGGTHRRIEQMRRDLAGAIEMMESMTAQP